jgi:hypothetical protein
MALTFIEILDDIGKLTVKQLAFIGIFLLGFSMIFFLLSSDLNLSFILALVCLAGNYLVRKDQEGERRKNKKNEK